MGYSVDGRAGLSELADYVGPNASCLSTLFKRETGLSVTKHVQRERITTAKNMLKYSNYSVQKIATTLAFSSKSYFTKAFR